MFILFQSFFGSKLVDLACFLLGAGWGYILVISGGKMVLQKYIRSLRNFQVEIDYILHKLIVIVKQKLVKGLSGSCYIPWDVA